MGKKVLVISASPRKGGNSDVLCDEFINGAQKAGHETEKVFIRNKSINYCTGCGFCVNKANGCAQKDDMKDILESMVSADVIVMATPVYFYTMNGQMKTFIDRVCPAYTKLDNKEFYFIATAADSNKSALERTIDGFRGFTDCLNNPKEMGIIYGSGVWEKEDVKKKKALLQEAFQMGEKI